MAGFDPSKYGSKKSKLYGGGAADTRVDSGAETGFDPSRYGDSKSRLYSPGRTVTMPEAAEAQQKKRERQVVSPYGTFLGGFSFARGRQKSEKELADEKAQQEAYLQEYRRLAGLDLDDYRAEVEQAGKKAQESKEPYNIHAFGAYNPQKSEAERTYAAMKADLNKAESIQYDIKGREALDNLTEDQTAALEVLTDTTGVPAAAAHVDAARKQAAREALLASGFTEDELSQLVNYYRNIPKREKNAERYAKVQEMARNEGEKSPIGGTLLSVPANLLSGVGAIDAALRKLADPNTPTDYNAPAMLPYAYASGVRGEVTKNLQYDHGDVAAFAYGVGTSMLDSAATVALAALGVPPAAASATLGGAAATDAMVAAKDRGLDDDHAIATGVAAGILESFFEKVSLESLISMKLPSGTMKQRIVGMLKNTAIQAGIEGSEEVFTDIGNLLADKIINGDMTDVNQRIAVYMAGGMSYQEAQQKVVGETIKDMAVDFGAGALAGGLMGGGNMAVQTAVQGRYQDAMQQVRQQSGVTGAYQASEDGRTTYHDTDAQIRSVVKDGKVQLESGETVDPKDVRFKDQQTADLYEGAINTAENAGAAQVFVDSYTGGDVSQYLLGMRQAYETGRAGIPVEEMTRGTFADDLSEAQRSAAYEQGRLATEAEFPAMGDMGLGEAGSAAWAEAEKINTTLSKGKVQAGFTALYQAGLRRESAVNVKSAAASALPQSVQTAAYEAGLSDAAASLAREKAGLDFVSSAGSESGLVDNEYSQKMAKEQAGTAALLNTLGKNLGVRIEMVDTISGGKANGVYIGGKNLIQIAADADNAFGFVAAHEVTHRMQELAPEEYRAYRDHAMSYRARETGEEGAAAYVERYRAMAEEAGVKLTQEEAMDEIAADFTRDMMENGKLFEDFAKENRSGARKLLDALKAFIAKVKSLFHSRAAQDRAAQDAYGKSMAELEQCVALWQKAYDAAGKQAQKAKTAAREGDGEGRFSIKQFPNGMKYVKADRQVLFGSDPMAWSEQLESYINGKIRNHEDVRLIAEDGDVLLLTSKSAGKLSSVYDNNGRTLGEEAFERKANAAAHIDELIKVSVRGGKTVLDFGGRHGDMAKNGWNYRTAYFMDYNEKYYRTRISVALGEDGSIVYNIGDMQERSIPQINGSSGNSGAQRGNASTDSISTSGEKVNGKFSLKAYSDVEKKQHVKDAKAFFGRTYKWAETGYITTDGARLDFSGKHEGGPGGYRTVDHRDIRDALGDDYGGDDYSGAMVQFMGEGNIRISPESGGINLSVMPTKAQMDTLSDFISKERGEVVLDLDDTNGVTLSSTEYPRGTHSNKVLNDIKAFFETGATPQVSELGKFRYQLKSFSEQAVSTALYDALSEKATRQNQLIPVSVMPRYISEKLGIGGDIYIQRDHAYENMVSKEQAIQDGRPTQRKGENVHFHDLGVEKMTRAIMSINEPTMTISTKTKDGNPAVIMMLPEYGNNNAPLYAVLSFYSRKTISPENRETRPHVVLTIAERNFFEDGGRVGWDELIRNAIKEGRVLDFNKKERSSLSEVAQSAGLGDITDASLKKNLAQFQKEVKQFRESNNIRYQLKSATELEKEVRELKKERRALENRNKVLTERVAKWRGELRRTETPSVRASDVKKLGRQFLSDYGSSTDYRAIEGDMTALGKALMADDVSMDTLRPHARAAAEKIIDGVLVQAESGGELLAIRDHLKNVTLRYTDDGSIPDFKDWRRANRRTLKISDKSGLDVDVAYSELTEMFGEGYFPSTIIHPGDQLLRMSEVLDNVGRIYENPFDGFRDAAVTELSDLLIDGMIGEDVRQSNPTFADRQALELQETKARLTQMLIKTREGRDRQVERMRRHYQEQTRAGRERRNATALRAKIARHTADLSRKLLTPTDKQHIPEKLRQSVAALLGSINQESAYSYDENGKLVHNADGDPTKRTQAAIALKNAYDEILKSGEALVIDPDLLGSEGAGLLDQVMALGNKRIADMNSEELTTVWQAVRAIEQSVSTFNKNLAIERYAGVQELAEALRDGSFSRKRANRKLALDLYDPYTFFYAYGEAGMQVYRTLRNAQDKQNTMLKTIQAAAEKFMDKEVYKNRLERHEFFVGEDGQRLVLTTGQIMNFYNLVGRGEQAVHHLTVGGVVQPAIKKNGKQAAIERGTENIRLTVDDLTAITGTLTEAQRKVAEGFQKIASGDLAKWGNEASMTVYGYQKFTEGKYWPIKAAPEGTKQDTEKNPNVAREIKNVGIAKARNPNANNALEIEGIYDVFARHASDMIQYSTLLAPMEDMNRLFNYRYRNATGNLTGKTVKDVLTDVYGEGAGEYWENLMRDVQNSIKGPDGAMARLVNEVVGNAKAASVGFNFHVVIQQPTAYIRAAAILDPSTMAKGIVGGATEGNGWEKAKKYAPIASIKDTAGFDQSSRYSIAQNVYGGEGGVMEWLNDKSGWAAGKADAVTWGAIWNACEWTVVNEGGYEKGSDAFFSRVAQVFTEVIDQSQVVDGIMQRAPVMRKPDLLMKQATAFMGEPLKALNMFMRSYDAWRFEQDTPKRSAAMKKMTRTIGAVLVTDVVNALVQSLVDAFRDDDKYKGYWARYWEKLTGFTGDKEKDTFLSVLLGSNIWDNIDPMGRIPFAKDVKSLMQGYTVYRMDADVVGDFINAAQLFIRSTQDEGKKTTLYAAKQLLTAGSKIFGVSVANVGRDVWAVARSVAQSSGNVRMMYEMERAIWRLAPDTGNNTRYYKLLYMAMQQQDKEAYQYIYGEMKKRGYSDGQLQNGIKSAIQDSGASDTDMRKQLEDIGYSGDEAQVIVSKWAFKEKYGYAYNEKGDAFVEGAITRQQLIDEMVSIGGKTREEAEAYVTQLQCEVDTGISYDDLRGAYSTGRIRYDQAVSYLKRYGGKDDESAVKTVEKWKFIGDNDDYDDITAPAVAKYNEYCASTGMSEDTYYKAWSVLHSMTGEDYDGDGENDAYSKMDKQLEYIGSLNISYDQMFALALASGISEKQINKRAPW